MHARARSGHQEKSTMTTYIKQDDLIESIAAAFQYISYYHPRDFLEHMADAYRREDGTAAKDAIGQILENSRLCQIGRRPICQDTGLAVLFIKVGMDVRWEGFTGSVEDAINEGVRRAYTFPDNVLRFSAVNPPEFGRKNTNDNTPAIIHWQIVPGDKVEVSITAKGGGSENKARLAMLVPSADVADWVVSQLPGMGSGWCPPGILGIGIGGTAEKCALLAKEALNEPLDMMELLKRGPQNDLEKLRVDIYNRVNALGIGAQGLGGRTTVLDVKIKMAATHAACKPVCVIPNCAATRHAEFVLDGSGPVYLEPPKLDEFPEFDWKPDQTKSRRVNLDELTKEEIASWKPGDTLLLSGKMLTGRDAAHKRISEMLARGEKLPVDFHDRAIYYVGPVDPVESKGEAVGPAGPTTSTRMDKFVEMMLSEPVGLGIMVGKAERGPAAREAIKKHGSAYLIAVGGAAYLLAKSIKKSRVLAFEDLGMEAIYEFEIEDMPVICAVDHTGESIHEQAPKIWSIKLQSKA